MSDDAGKFSVLCFLKTHAYSADIYCDMAKDQHPSHPLFCLIKELSCCILLFHTRHVFQFNGSGQKGEHLQCNESCWYRWGRIKRKCEERLYLGISYPEQHAPSTRQTQHKNHRFVCSFSCR